MVDGGWWDGGWWDGGMMKKVEVQGCRSVKGLGANLTKQKEAAAQRDWLLFHHFQIR
ncbi:hypothetical protein AB4114_28175 [Paenibacillus sp. 2RAB27]|uniref:hypothetical protein n=1 Tax=Paenibacillus sp. 2RAB27 TaxID=3232991 RepID=UPI003F944393